MAVESELKFTNSESFRLFTTGLEALQAYEREARQETLSQAKASLEQCVRNYPNDVLPLFYLGVVRTLQGYPGLDEALALFQKVLDRGIKELEPAAKFHLAWAHLERYLPEDFVIAERELNEMLADIEKQKASAETTNLRMQAEAMLAFIYVRQSLWIRREEGKPLESEVAEAERRLSQLKAEVDRSDLPQPAKADLLAEYWNTKGILLWFQAWTALNKQAKVHRAQEAVSHFQLALQHKVNWIPPMQNLARVSMELLDRNDEAEETLWETLEVHPDNQYSFYLLGKIYETKDTTKAIEYYKRAVHIPEAQKALERLQSGTTPASGAAPKASP